MDSRLIPQISLTELEYTINFDQRNINYLKTIVIPSYERTIKEIKKDNTENNYDKSIEFNEKRLQKANQELEELTKELEEAQKLYAICNSKKESIVKLSDKLTLGVTGINLRELTSLYNNIKSIREDLGEYSGLIRELYEFLEKNIPREKITAIEEYIKSKEKPEQQEQREQTEQPPQPGEPEPLHEEERNNDNEPKTPTPPPIEQNNPEEDKTSKMLKDLLEKLRNNVDSDNIEEQNDPRIKKVTSTKVKEFSKAHKRTMIKLGIVALTATTIMCLMPLFMTFNNGNVIDNETIGKIVQLLPGIGEYDNYQGYHFFGSVELSQLIAPTIMASVIQTIGIEKLCKKLRGTSEYYRKKKEELKKLKSVAKKNETNQEEVINILKELEDEIEEKYQSKELSKREYGNLNEMIINIKVKMGYTPEYNPRNQRRNIQIDNLDDLVSNYGYNPNIPDTDYYENINPGRGR